MVPFIWHEHLHSLTGSLGWKLAAPPPHRNVAEVSRREARAQLRAGGAVEGRGGSGGQGGAVEGRGGSGGQGGQWRAGGDSAVQGGTVQCSPVHGR